MENLPKKYLNPDQCQRLADAVKSPRHKLIIFLLLDGGLLVDECLSLKYSNFDFEARRLYVRGQNKRSHKGRWIPLSDRLYNELRTHIYPATLGLIAAKDAFLFPSYGESGHISGSTVGALLRSVRKQVSEQALTPGLLRQTFIQQQLRNGLSEEDVNSLLGIPPDKTAPDQAQVADKAIETKRRSTESKAEKDNAGLFGFIQKFLSPPKQKINLTVNPGGFITVGRNEVLTSIKDLIERKINAVIIGPPGVGKSHLLTAVEESDQEENTIKMLKLEDTSQLKSSLIQILSYILKTDTRGVLAFLYPRFDDTRILIKVNRDNTLHMAREIIKLTEEKCYTLIIDSVDRITPKAVKILELLKDHFTVITTARSIPVARSSFLWNFEIIRLKPLIRNAALELIESQSQDLRIEDLQLYKNHIYEQTNGNPRAILEIINRYRKEGMVTNKIISRIRHTGALPEFDCTFIILLFLACVACLRYLNHEVQNASFRVLGGIALVFLFITRYFFKSSRKTRV